MEHIYLFLIIISFAVTLTAIPVIILAYFRTKADYLKPYLAVIVIISWNFLRLLIFDYLKIMLNIKATFSLFPYNLMSLPEPFLALFAPSFIHKLFSLKSRKPDYFFFCLCLLSVLFLFVAGFNKMAAKFPESIFSLLFLGLMSYTLIFTIVKFKYARSKTLAVIWLCFSTVLVLFSLAGLLSKGLLPAGEAENSVLHAIFYLVFYFSSIAFSLVNIIFFTISLNSFNKHAAQISVAYMEAHSISRREQEIVRLVLAGKSNRVIARELFISVPTVKSHIYNIYRKFKVSSRFELMRKTSEQNK